MYDEFLLMPSLGDLIGMAACCLMHSFHCATDQMQSLLEEVHQLTHLWFAALPPLIKVCELSGGNCLTVWCIFYRPHTTCPLIVCVCVCVVCVCVCCVCVCSWSCGWVYTHVCAYVYMYVCTYTGTVFTAHFGRVFFTLTSSSFENSNPNPEIQCNMHCVWCGVMCIGVRLNADSI